MSKVRYHIYAGPIGPPQIHHVDSDSVQGRVIRYLFRRENRRKHKEDASPARILGRYDTACVCVKETGKGKRPYVLVLTPHYGVNFEFVQILKDDCQKQDNIIQAYAISEKRSDPVQHCRRMGQQ